MYKPSLSILQLCFVNNGWPRSIQVKSIDIKTGLDVLDLPSNYGQSFNLIIAAPPCDQFTKANATSWDNSPDYFISVAKKCFEICICSGQPWLFENPPGRIEKFIPALSAFRILTWHGNGSNKEYVIYSNRLFMATLVKRYGKPGSINNLSKANREKWTPDFWDFVINSFL